MHLGEEERRIYVSLTNQERLAGHGTSSTLDSMHGHPAISA